MGTITLLDRGQRRNRLAAQAYGADVPWFRDHPERSYAVRSVTPAEINLARTVHGRARPGWRYVMTVRRDPAGLFERRLALVTDHAGAPALAASEAGCRALFEGALIAGTPPHVARADDDQVEFGGAA